jgi:predicted DNA-binding transcriptional regulator YafY
MPLPFKLPAPVRPLYVWGGYIILAVVLAVITQGAAWTQTLMAIYLLWAIVETIRFYRHKKKLPAGEALARQWVEATARDAQAEPVSDDEEDDFLNAGKTVWQGSRQIRFAYQSNGGDYSDREVTVHKVVSMGRANEDTYFRGLCHMRGEPRTFRLDRIKGNKVADTSTGELATFRQLFGLRSR